MPLATPSLGPGQMDARNLYLHICHISLVMIVVKV